MLLFSCFENAIYTEYTYITDGPYFCPISPREKFMKVPMDSAVARLYPGAIIYRSNDCLQSKPEISSMQWAC